MGQFLQVIPKRDFSFDGRTGTTQDVPLAEDIDATSFSGGSLIVRPHDKNTWTGTAKVYIYAQNMSRADEEQQTMFAEDLAGTNFRARVEILSTDSKPKLYVQSLGSPISGQLRILLRYEQTGTQTAANTFSIGVDLVGRE